MDLLARSLSAIERGCGLVIVSWILGGIGCVLLILRLYTRAAILRRTGLDDWSMLIAVVSLKRYCNRNYSLTSSNNYLDISYR